MFRIALNWSRYGFFLHGCQHSRKVFSPPGSREYETENRRTKTESKLSMMGAVLLAISVNVGTELARVGFPASPFSADMVFIISLILSFEDAAAVAVRPKNFVGAETLEARKVVATGVVPCRFATFFRSFARVESTTSTAWSSVFKAYVGYKIVVNSHLGKNLTLCFAARDSTSSAWLVTKSPF